MPIVGQVPIIPPTWIRTPISAIGIATNRKNSIQPMLALRRPGAMVTLSDLRVIVRKFGINGR
jgi:hypothetical protein